MIYLDHAATTPLNEQVLQVMMPFFQVHYSNASSVYASARQSRRAVDAARTQVADLIGAKAQEIYFTSGGSEADNWALFGAMQGAGCSKGHIVTTSIEHAAILRTCEELERQGYAVTYVPVDENGVVSDEAVMNAITPETVLISVMLANNEVGTVQPVQAITQKAHEKGILVHTDAVQAVGHIPVDVNMLGVDMLSMSAHKFYGPKGIGALYIRKGTRIGRMVYGGEQEMGMRAGTENLPAIVGMGKAAELAGTGLGEDSASIICLRDKMIEALKHRISGVRINGEMAERLPGHVHITVDGIDSSLVMMQLDMMGIAASSGSACAAGAAERSHVIRAMGICGENQADIRFSLGVMNTYDEILKTVEALAKIIGQ